MTIQCQKARELGEALLDAADMVESGRFKEVQIDEFKGKMIALRADDLKDGVITVIS